MQLDLCIGEDPAYVDVFSEAHDWMTFGCSKFGWFLNSGLGGVSGTSSGTFTGIFEFVRRVLGALPSTVLRVALISV